MVESAYETFSVPSNSTANDTDAPDTFAVTVPDGQVWYVDSVGFDSDTSTDASPGNVFVGISSIPKSSQPSRFIPRVARSAQEGSPTSHSQDVSFGAYAYGGETIYVGIHQTNASATGYLSARRMV